MSLTFHSEYPNATIWVAILWYHPDCKDGNFLKTGWWSLTDGESVDVLSGDLAWLNEYYYYYAEASDGAVWNGPINVQVTDNAFNACVWDPSGDDRTVGFQLLDIGDNWSFTVNLVPANYQQPGGGGDGWGDGDGGDGGGTTTGDGDGDGDGWGDGDGGGDDGGDD